MRRLAFLIGGVFLVAFGAPGRAHSPPIYLPSPCSVLNAEPCHPAVCDVSHDGSCFPDHGTPTGQRPRMTVATSEENARDKPLKDRRDEGQLVNTLHDMFAALRVCWLPPPPEKSRPGMEYTIRFAFKSNGELMAPARMTYATHGVPDDVRDVYREAVEATFRRCTPMHFSTGMAGAIAGRPIIIHFFDDRITTEHFKQSDDPGK